MHNPLVSILIPNYNKAPYIRETLDSVLAQTYTNWECIIVDDHSTDDSWEILQEYQAKDSRFKIYKRPDHLPKGGNACRNYAFELSKGEYVNWFDSDDVMFCDLIQNRLSIILLEKFDFVVSGGVLKNKNLNKILGYTRVNQNINFLVEEFILLNPSWCTLSAFFSKKYLIENEIIWDEELLNFQDVIFNFLCLLKSTSFCMIIENYDFIWRNYLDINKVSYNSYGFSKISNLAKALIKIHNLGSTQKINNFDSIFKASVYLAMYKSSKHFSLYWFRVLILPFFKIKVLKTKDLLVIFSLVILSFFAKKINRKSIFDKKIKIWFYKKSKELYNYDLLKASIDIADIK